MAGSAEAICSGHARLRAAQSNLCDRDLELVCRYGVLEHRTGVQFYFLRRRDVQRFPKVEPRLIRLHGVVVIMSVEDEMIITIYRNRRALKDIRRKSKVRQGAAA